MAKPGTLGRDVSVYESKPVRIVLVAQDHAAPAHILLIRVTGRLVSRWASRRRQLVPTE
jgi:hypothetical protein